MKTKRRIVTAETKRRAATGRAVIVSVVAVVAVAALLKYLTPYLDTSTVVTLILCIAGLAGVIVAACVFRRPRRLICAVSTRTMGKAERRFIRRVRRRWVKACRDSGITREDRDPEILTIHVPRVTSIQAVPLGIKMTVQPVPGQPAEDVAKHADHLASAFGSWVRAEVVGPTACQIIAELNDPLDGIRQAGQTTSTDITVGRCDDGSDARIDLSEASHIAVQGMTRSGKSALCYTIFGQLIASDAVRVTGVDPNRVLLEPLALAEKTDTDDFVLGNDPVAALALLTKACHVLDARAQLLTEWGIAAHERFHHDFRVWVMLLEEYAGLLRQAAAHDEGAKSADKIGPKIKQAVGRLVSEGAKAGIRVVLITQRMDASIIDGDSRGQFGTRITMAVDNGDAVRMLHPAASPETVHKVTQLPPGRCLLWQHRRERLMQADFTDYGEYRARLGLSAVPDLPATVDEAIR